METLHAEGVKLLEIRVSMVCSATFYKSDQNRNISLLLVA
jgi:hypothetical protein